MFLLGNPLRKCLIKFLLGMSLRKCLIRNLLGISLRKRNGFEQKKHNGFEQKHNGFEEKNVTDSNKSMSILAINSPTPLRRGGGIVF